MSCQKIESLLALYIYDELSKSEQDAVENHIKSCSLCAQKVTHFKDTMSLYSTKLEPVPQPDWERSWDRIRERLEVQSSLQQEKTSTYRPTMRWAGALAASVAIFVFGLLMGMYLFHPSTEPGELTSNRQALTNTATLPNNAQYFEKQLSQHMEDIKPVIVQYANYWSDKDTLPGKPLPIEKKMVLDLLIRNQMLLCNLPDENNLQMQKLLKELKVILVKIALLTLDDPESLAIIKQMIRKKGLLFKMEALRPIESEGFSL
jgi:hypothetical protein